MLIHLSKVFIFDGAQSATDGAAISRVEEFAHSTDHRAEAVLASLLDFLCQGQSLKTALDVRRPAKGVRQPRVVVT